MVVQLVRFCKTVYEQGISEIYDSNGTKRGSLEMLILGNYLI